jgi:hypothetical protein
MRGLLAIVTACLHGTACAGGVLLAGHDPSGLFRVEGAL